MSTPSQALEQLLQVMDALRHPEHGCPWDLKQDYSSIAKHTLEEAYEVVDAIEEGDMDALKSELGDLLFQVVFYARLGSEEGAFDFAGIAKSISEKLLHRHPHVFPEGTLESAGQKPDINAEHVVNNWEEIKKAERAGTSADINSVMNDVPQALPAIMRANKLQKRAAHEGFDWTDQAGVIEKLKEEMAELEEAMQAQNVEQTEEEFGDLMFTMVNLSRHLKLNAESCLRKANRKFESRFRHMEILLAKQGRSINQLSLEEMDACWHQVKQLNTDSNGTNDA